MEMATKKKASTRMWMYNEDIQCVLYIYNKDKERLLVDHQENKEGDLKI